ncbi:MAG: DEAD/DEAH box helicase [Bacteroidales bacterium]
MTFKELNISEPILRALADKKYETPTPIQQQAIPVAMSGKDMLGVAQTGTGKTAAFAIPIIEHLSSAYNENRGKRQIKALVLTPTRELAIQIEEAFADYGKYSGLKHTVVYGGVSQKPQTDKLSRGTDILIATPGRLLDLISQRYVKLDGITHFVLDEADRMLDMGFIHDIKRLMPLLPKNRQTLFFSATMPKEIVAISKTILNNPVRIEVERVSSVVDTIEQCVYFVEKPEKTEFLIKLLNNEGDKSVLVFSRTKHGADKITKALLNKRIGCEALHGNKSQAARQRALSNFKSGKTRIIVATDIAARGIDIHDLGMVINYDLPDVAETYVHRIGRTGRAGHHGVALTLCSREEQTMVRSIQKLTGKKLNAVHAPV